MLAAGVCNTVAFIALTKSLQLTSIVYVNSLNATQATMAAIAGVFIFGEDSRPGSPSASASPSPDCCTRPGSPSHAERQ